MGHLIFSQKTLDAARRGRRRDPGCLVASLGPSPGLVAAEVRLNIADPGLRARLEGALALALAPAREAAPALPVWKLSTITRARALGPAMAGALVIVRASEQNAARLARLAALAEAAGAAGVQIACPAPLPPALERVVFGLLEERRGQPGRMPLALAPFDSPAEVLLRTIAARGTR